MSRAADTIYMMIGITLGVYGALALYELGFKEGRDYAITRRVREKNNILQYPFRNKSWETKEAGDCHSDIKCEKKTKKEKVDDDPGETKN